MSSTNAALFQHIEVQNPLEQDAPAINTNPANFPTLTSVAHSTTIRSDTTMSSLSVPASGSMTVSSVAGTKPGSSGLGLDDLQDERDQDQQQAELQPCENFNLVAPGIYRSAFPKKRNFSFLKKLGLRSILTLILEDYPDQNRKFLDDNNIHLFQFGVAGNKEPFVDIPEETVCAALSVIMDERNHPLLIHCNKGKHRTGCLVGCLRKMQHWSMTSIFDEYRRFSHPKSRSMDQQFIELFETHNVSIDIAHLPNWAEIQPDEFT